jgi:excisionase family DNA binding protein
VKQACKVAGIGRTTFYKLLDDARSGLAELVLRVPGLGHIRIPEREFRRWLESSGTKRAGRKTKNPT